MSENTELITSLIRLGFTQYEAQAYAALVGQAALTGAEVGRRAGMPPSKIYETLGRLEARGAVLVNRSEPVRYAAVPHRSLLEDLRSASMRISKRPRARSTGCRFNRSRGSSGR